jgi:hypothetical protein
MTLAAYQFAVNRPMVLPGAGAGTVVRGLTVGVVPLTVAQGGIADPNAQVVVNDAVSLATAAAGNVIWSAPLSALYAGMAVTLTATLSNGLVVSQVPRGAALAMDYL